MQELTCPDMIHGKILGNENKIIDLSQSDKNLLGNVHKWRPTFFGHFRPHYLSTLTDDFSTITSDFGDDFGSPYLP